MKTIRSMFQHLYWANDKICSALTGEATIKCDEARQLFAHILCAERIWLARILGEDTSTLPVWGSLTIEQCEQLANQNEQNLEKYLQSLKSSDLDTPIHYSNSKGVPFVMSLRNILIHIALHGQYHRGQINARLRAAGLEPEYVDYLGWAREEN